MPIDPNTITWDDEPKPDAGGIQWDGPAVTKPATIKPAVADARPDPTGTFGENLAAGLGQFFVKLGSGGKQVLDDSAVWLRSQAGDSALGRAVDEADRRLGLQSPEQIQAQGRQAEAERRQLDQPLDATWGGKLGNAAGALTLGAVLPGSTFAQAAGTGSFLGATEPVAEDGERLRNASVGALGGAGALGLTKAAARVIRPNTDAAVDALVKEGVMPTPGHVLGGAAARVEDALTSVPILGDVIRLGQSRAVGQLNTAAINRSLAPIGMAVPEGVTGREAIQFADDALSTAYNRILPKLTVRADPQFLQNVNALKQMVRTGSIGPDEAAQFERIVQNGLLGKLRGQDALTGQTLKQIESDLGRVASMYRRDPSADKRMLGDAVLELQSMVRDWVQRSNPQFADQLRQINMGWANLVRVKKAAASVAAEDGVFSAGQLHGAVKAADRSKDKSAFAKGTALMQDLSESGRKVLGSKVPDSGTPTRLMTAAAGGGLGAVLAPKAVVAAAAPMVAYTPLGQRIIAELLTQRPASAEALAKGVRLLGPYMSTLGASTGQKISQ